MEKKRFAFEVKQVDLEAGTFEGHASVFGIPDDGRPPDVMQPGAFSRTIREWGPGGKNRIKILAQHRSWDLPIGKPLELAEDETGLFVKAKISDTDLGRDVLTLLRDGVLTELSIGFETIRSDVDKQNGFRRVQEVRLYEISAVTWAMHPDALITTVKKIDDVALPGDEPDPALDTIRPPAEASDLEPELLRSIQTLTADIQDYARRHLCKTN